MDTKIVKNEMQPYQLNLLFLSYSKSAEIVRRQSSMPLIKSNFLVELKI